MNQLTIHRGIICFLLLVVVVLLCLFPRRPSADKTLGSLAERQKDLKRPEYPIKFDRDLNEYHLVYHQTNADASVSKVHTILRYDPFSGVRLPESKRDELFVTPDNREMAKIESQLRGVTTLEGVRGVIGTPDLTYGPFDGVRTQWTYSRLAKTLEIVVQENTAGQVSVCYLPKTKGTN